MLLTGVMAAGKSTVAQLLAERLPRSVHVRGDIFRRFVVTGRADPTPDMSAEAWSQLRLRYQLAATTADSYAAAGFAVVVQDVIIGPVLREVVGMIRTRPRHLVVLDPDPVAIAAREQTRTKAGYADRWASAQLVSALRDTTPRLGLWLNTTHQDPEDTVQTVLDRLAEADIGDVPGLSCAADAR